MRWFVGTFLILTLLFAGCGSCDETSGSHSNNHLGDAGADADPNCTDGDGDGYASGEQCTQAELDCNDADSSVHPGADEACGDGVDNNCDGQTDEDCQDCTDGDTRQCGSDVGACQMGTQTCRQGTWSECEGEVRPTVESCDGADNDCDGEIDEDPELRLCDDGIKCNGAETCEQGACVDAEPVDCSQLDEPCFEGVCLEKDGSCAQKVIPDGTTCDDGNFCTVSGTCNQGVCETQPRDCSNLSDQCNEGICDEQNDTCVAQPKSDGTTCDDGEFCTVGDSCQAGSCAGSARSCASAGDQCNTGICDEGADACVPQPVSDGTSCDDGQYCTTGDTCQAGQCAPGAPRQCGAAGGSCRTGTCDEQNDTCTGDPVPDGTSCDDGQFCTTGDTCQAGTCAGGGPTDCSSAGDQCNDGVCDEQVNRCEPAPKPDGTSCDDGQFCTNPDQCVGGSCTGSSRDCSMVADQCNDGTCDEQSDACVAQPKSDGTACSDGAFCTVGDSCSAGACAGSPRNCSSLSDACHDGVCDDSADACVAQTKADGTSCDDGEFCTANDTCSSGTCSGTARDCSAAAGNDACSIGVCDENFDQCKAAFDNTCCDNSVDNDLDGSGQCDDCDDTNGGVYPGATEVCNGVDDDCDGAIDEDFDADGDGYSTCSSDPLLNDCDDTAASVYPGATEQCNGVDDDCDGYVDEGCGNCSSADADGDGVSECGGDCDDTDAAIYPGAAEVCDGKDNDCNQLTVANCDVSEPCNFASGADVCMDDRICACILDRSGNCTGNYQCTPFCNWSQTGPIGDGCGADQTCMYDLLYSSNIHGCGVVQDTPGSKTGGQACGGDSECRSLNCDKLCRGPGCNQNYCIDSCGSDAYCPSANAVCRISDSGGDVDGQCWPAGGPLVGSSSVGSSCTTDYDCDHGHCMTDPNDGTKYCTEPCCTDTDCGTGYTCSMRGTSHNAVDQRTGNTLVYSGPNAPSCSTDADCTGTGGSCVSGTCAWTVQETSPMCVKDVSGQGSRQAGQACTQNSQCASNFCEASRGVCISACCNDSVCPTGLTCEKQFVQNGADQVSQVRVCVNQSTDGVLERK